MRVMWTTNNSRKDADFMKKYNMKFVKRIISREFGCKTAFITSENVYNDIIFNKGGNTPVPDILHWNITSCNKQYITEINTDYPGSESIPDRRYLGCMCKVSFNTATAHILSNPYANWYLLDKDTNTRWIAREGNPNTILGGVQHIDDNKPPLFPKQERPWPLKGETYEEWKKSVIDAMIGLLHEKL